MLSVSPRLALDIFQARLARYARADDWGGKAVCWCARRAGVARAGKFSGFAAICYSAHRNFRAEFAALQHKFHRVISRYEMLYRNLKNTKYAVRIPTLNRLNSK